MLLRYGTYPNIYLGMYYVLVINNAMQGRFNCFELQTDVVVREQLSYLTIKERSIRDANIVKLFIFCKLIGV